MEQPKAKKKCAYYEYCYIAEGADCFGYKSDCALYMVTNDRPTNEASFHKAMDQLIDKTKLKFSEPKK